jgi:ABC-type nitrate/sulfonate/bicarbonate transport system substrate-binding protein
VKLSVASSCEFFIALNSKVDRKSPEMVEGFIRGWAAAKALPANEELADIIETLSGYDSIPRKRAVIGNRLPDESEPICGAV